VVAAALAAGIAVRGAMSCTVGCPYEGDIAPERVGHLASLMKGIGVQRVDVADTIGVGTPLKVQKALESTLQHFDVDNISGHFHDTYGQALANTLAALDMGVWNFQSSVAGLGGCPYAKGATGNVATEDLVYMLHGMGIETGIDLDKLVDAGKFISDFLGRPSGSRVAAFLQQLGHVHMPLMLGDAARTAQQAADGLVVLPGQIAKSIVFRRKSDDMAVMVVTSGDQRVDEKKLEALVCADGQRLGRADAAFVKARTGFSIGGVSPLAHAGQVLLVLDQSLQRFDTVWAAAGHPNAVFQLSPQALAQLTAAPWVDVADVPLVPVVPAVNEEAPSQRQAAIDHLRACADHRPATGAVPSPCISVCQINAATGCCEGCFRTLDEIAGWSAATPEAKRKFWRDLAQRLPAAP
jgi:prolyl-tRNA editing enzyme YbaK/EbsC (Cys-tRNA(Pro) deacylase)/predicted Fe-S protein YdhL (DUF1289 family)